MVQIKSVVLGYLLAITGSAEIVCRNGIVMADLPCPDGNVPVVKRQVTSSSTTSKSVTRAIVRGSTTTQSSLTTSIMSTRSSTTSTASVSVSTTTVTVTSVSISTITICPSTTTTTTTPAITTTPSTTKSVGLCSTVAATMSVCNPEFKCWRNDYRYDSNSNNGGCIGCLPRNGDCADGNNYCIVGYADQSTCEYDSDCGAKYGAEYYCMASAYYNSYASTSGTWKFCGNNGNHYGTVTRGLYCNARTNNPFTTTPSTSSRPSTTTSAAAAVTTPPTTPSTTTQTAMPS